VNNDGVGAVGKSGEPLLAWRVVLLATNARLLVAVPRHQRPGNLRGDVVQVARIRGDDHGGHRGRGGKSLAVQDRRRRIDEDGRIEPERKARGSSREEPERTCNGATLKAVELGPVYLAATTSPSV